MSSIKQTERLIKSLMALQNRKHRKIKDIKSKLSHGHYKVGPRKVAEAFFLALSSGMAIIRVADDEVR